ncbi:membrane protein involved in aromatic hydrocarbon degradation [Desulfurispirillum indicum S5]|uniref:Membrane protein involved in aromatic hydrocarbon degradation n=2 Tax=Desulfurispirillum TaxID=393029 RepID=E6W6B0_DESIS|nr:membrane protein involved in aromatic hydrocarbon degradation [Desulfurispirillum indicum S5]
MSGKRMAFAVSALLCSGITHAYGAGFGITTQGVSGLGNAYSGGAAIGADATTVYFNPAAMTLLKGKQVVGGMTLIVPDLKFKDDGSTTGGSTGGQPGQNTIVPNFYSVVELENGLYVGLGINAPFGNATDYKEDWYGRYYAIKSDFMTVNVNPSIAWRVNDQFSVGAGLSLQYLDAELSNAIDFGTIAYAQSGYNEALAPLVHNRDGKVVLEADDTGYGFNFGFLYEFNDQTRMGFAYRSTISYTASGSAKFTVPETISGNPALDGAIAASPNFANGSAKAKIKVPDSASLSVHHQVNPDWAVMADVTWMGWSSFDELRVQFSDGRDDSVTTFDWEDQMRYSVGTTYRLNPRTILRAGLALDEEAIPDAQARQPRVPGNDRTWISVGLGYQVNERMGIDVGYAHLMVKDAKIDQQQSVPENTLKGSLRGEYSNTINIVGVSLTYSF